MPLAGHASPPGYTQYVILDSTNGHSDTVEAGATISQPGLEDPVALPERVRSQDQVSCSRAARLTWLTSRSPSRAGRAFCGRGAVQRSADDHHWERRPVHGQGDSEREHVRHRLSELGPDDSCFDADGALAAPRRESDLVQPRAGVTGLDAADDHIDLEPASPDGLGGWYVSSVNATVSATDSESSWRRPAANLIRPVHRRRSTRSQVAAPTRAQVPK